MKFLWFMVYLLLCNILPRESTAQSFSPPTNTCLSKTEKELYNLIMKYRSTKKLPVIPLSQSLTFVAQTHSKDLYENRADKDPCNQHSWSANGPWKPCCYYPDHRNKECMWDKPKELTNYSAPGFEIAYFHSSAALPAEALDAWKTSKGHNAVLVNTGIWKGQKWNAIGIGVYKNYATVWFGMQKDEAGPPGNCAP